MTIVELLVGLTIAAIMMAFAIPAFNTFTNQQRITTSANLVVSALNYARSEAARSGTDATVQLLDAANDDDEWGPGFCVTLLDPGNCDDSLTTFNPDGDLTLDGIGGLHTVDAITFNSQGMVSGGVIGNIEICGPDADQDPGRVVRISATGRASVGDFVCFP